MCNFSKVYIICIDSHLEFSKYLKIKGDYHLHYSWVQKRNKLRCMNSDKQGRKHSKDYNIAVLNLEKLIVYKLTLLLK